MLYVPVLISSGEKPCKCKVCGKSLGIMQYARCSECHKFLNNVPVLISRGEKTCKCEVCGKSLGVM